MACLTPVLISYGVFAAFSSLGVVRLLISSHKEGIAGVLGAWRSNELFGLIIGKVRILFVEALGHV